MTDRLPPPRAKDKLAFLLALVPYLIDQVRVTVDEAAAHFGISAEQMRATVMLIAMSGSPGADGTYTHETLFDIDWDDFENHDIIRFRRAPMDEKPRFSAREAAALMAGLQRVAGLPGFAARVDITALMAKLARGASAAPAPLAVRASHIDSLQATIVDAIENRRRLRIDYITTRGEREWRDVDPIRLDGVDDAWYLQAWCVSREAERTFLLDRIASIEPRGPADTHVATAHGGELFRGSPDDLLVTVEIAAATLPLLADYLGTGVSTTPAGDQVRVTLPISHPGILGRIAARLAGDMEVIEPPSARSALVDWARTALEAHSSGSFAQS